MRVALLLEWIDIGRSLSTEHLLALLPKVRDLALGGPCSCPSEPVDHPQQKRPIFLVLTRGQESTDL